MRFYPVGTYSSDNEVGRVDGRAGIVFSVDDAAEMMNTMGAAFRLICIDFPRAKVCSTLAEAHEFYADKNHGAVK